MGREQPVGGPESRGRTMAWAPWKAVPLTVVAVGALVAALGTYTKTSTFI